MTAPPLPPGLAALTTHWSVSTHPWDTLGQLDLRVDRRTRLRMKRGRRNGHVVVEVRLASLPSAPRDREELLARTLLHVTAAAGRQKGVLALSADGEQLLLQAELDGTEVGGFKTSLEAFLNEVDHWKAVAGTAGA